MGYGGRIVEYEAKQAGSIFVAFIQAVVVITAAAIVVGLVALVALGFVVAYGVTFAVGAFDRKRGRAMRSGITASWRNTRSAPARVGSKARTVNAPPSTRTVVVRHESAPRVAAASRPANPRQTAMRTRAPAPPDIPSQIRKLHELKAAGILTEAEFEAKKRQLLARM